MEKIPNSSKLVERYLSDLSIQEDELAKIRKMIDEAEITKTKEDQDVKTKKSECSTLAQKLLEEMVV